jgi:predicted Mrr-cat superfamily restriction endonuclease
VCAWRLRAWDDPELELAWEERKLTSMSFDEIGDVTEWPGEEALARRLAAAPGLTGRSRQAIGLFVTYWRYFRVEMEVGDIVAVPLSGRRVGVARLAGPYEYVPDETEPHCVINARSSG